MVRSHSPLITTDTREQRTAPRACVVSARTKGGLRSRVTIARYRGETHTSKQNSIVLFPSSTSHKKEEPCTPQPPSWAYTPWKRQTQKAPKTPGRVRVPRRVQNVSPADRSYTFPLAHQKKRVTPLDGRDVQAATRVQQQAVTARTTQALHCHGN